MLLKIYVRRPLVLMENFRGVETVQLVASLTPTTISFTRQEIPICKARYRFPRQEIPLCKARITALQGKRYHLQMVA